MSVFLNRYHDTSITPTTATMKVYEMYSYSHRVNAVFTSQENILKDIQIKQDVQRAARQRMLKIILNYGDVDKFGFLTDAKGYLASVDGSFIIEYWKDKVPSEGGLSVSLHEMPIDPSQQPPETVKVTHYRYRVVYLNPTSTFTEHDFRIMAVNLIVADQFYRHVTVVIHAFWHGLTEEGAEVPVLIPSNRHYDIEIDATM